MSDASIIQQLTLNQPLTFNTTTGIDRVKIHNDSSFYLRIYFGLGAPTQANSGGWHDTVSPGASPVLVVVGASKGPVGFDLTNSLTTGTYQGQIVVLPFLPAGAPQPSGGVVTGAALCYLTGYYPDEFAETAGQVEAFIQAAKQGRYQEVQGAVVAAPAISFDQTTVASNTLMDTIGNGVTAPLFLANVAGNSVINLYVYGWGGTLRNQNPNVATLNIIPAFVITDNTGVTTRQTIQTSVRRMVRAVNFGADSWYYPFNPPLLFQFSFTQGALAFSDVLRYRFLPIDQSGVFDGQIFCTYLLDKVNQTPLLALPNIPAPGGVITNQPWNATYNPQTY